MGETTAIVKQRWTKYKELYQIIDELEPVKKSSDDGWAFIKLATRHDAHNARYAVSNRQTGIQTESDGTRWKMQTRVHYPFSDRRTIFYFRKVIVND